MGREARGGTPLCWGQGVGPSQIHFRGGSHPDIVFFFFFQNNVKIGEIVPNSKEDFDTEDEFPARNATF